MKIGFTSTTLRPIKDLAQIAQIAKQAGADCIEWGGDIHVTNLQSALLAKTACQNAGIEILSYGTYYRVGCGDLAKWISICEIAKAMEARVIRVWLGTRGSKKTTAFGYKRILQDLADICAVANRYGLLVAPECHPNTFNDNTMAFLQIHKDLKQLGHADNFRTYFQSLYKNLAYDFNRIERTAGEIEIVHISYSERIREQLFCRKNKNYIAMLLKKLKETGYDNTVLLEYTCFSKPDCLIKDLERLKKDLQ